MEIQLKTSELLRGDKIYKSPYWYTIEELVVYHSWSAMRLTRTGSRGNLITKHGTSPKNNLHLVKQRRDYMTLEEIEVKVYQSLGDLDVKIHRHVDALALPDMVEVAPTISVERKIVTDQTKKEMMAELNKLVEFVRQF